MAWKTFWMSSGLFVLDVAYKIENMAKIELPGGMTLERLRGLTVEQVLDYGEWLFAEDEFWTKVPETFAGQLGGTIRRDRERRELGVALDRCR